jgi:peptidoglycan/xylan/chitin deacetylase (PgdA/CDA1 family)
MQFAETLLSPVGVCVLPPRPRNAPRTVSYGHYLHEILAHAGVCYQTLHPDELEGALPHLRVLVTVGDTALPNATIDALSRWVGEGGMWLAIGGTAGAPALFGVREESATYSGWGASIGTLGEGYLQVETADHPVLEHVPVPLHFFNGVPVHASTGIAHAGVLDAHQRATSRAAVVERRVGNGRCLFIAPDVIGTIVRIQQGVAVTRDGISAPDGTAPICDDMLKSSDGAVLDWWFDRQPVEGVSGFHAFLHPIADIWREIIIRAILYLAQLRKAVLPILWLYPRNLPAIAHLSHDTDGNDPALAERMLEVLREAGIHSTWCVIPPGYPQHLIERIRTEGHELAMHFDAVEEDSLWDEGAFHEQWRALKKLFGGEPPLTNKNHYLRWEGDTEFFEWCQRRGVQLDQSKGPSKTGEAGFNFGTCHPYFPVDPRGRTIDVLELPTLTQDLNVFAPDALLEPLLQAALRHHGVLHVLFHPAHVDKPGVAGTILHSIRTAQERGMEWWTARRINEWERARRALVWREYVPEEGGVCIRLEAAQALEEATLLFVGQQEGTVEVGGQWLSIRPTVRWGVPTGAVTLDLDGEVTLRLR